MRENLLTALATNLRSLRELRGVTFVGKDWWQLRDPSFTVGQLADLLARCDPTARVYVERDEWDEYEDQPRHFIEHVIGFNVREGRITFMTYPVIAIG